MLRHKRYCHNLGRNLNGTLVSDGSTVFAVSNIAPPAADDNHAKNTTRLLEERASTTLLRGG